MIRARQSSDPYAIDAHRILDRVRSMNRNAKPGSHENQGKVSAERINWALAYLGDTDGSVKIPHSLMGSGRKREPA